MKREREKEREVWKVRAMESIKKITKFLNPDATYHLIISDFYLCDFNYYLPIKPGKMP